MLQSGILNGQENELSQSMRHRDIYTVLRYLPTGTYREKKSNRPGKTPAAHCHQAERALAEMAETRSVPTDRSSQGDAALVTVDQDAVDSSGCP